jgi:hypothetical protein
MSSDNKIRVEAPDFKTIYTNFVESGYGPFDISIVLSQSVINSEGNMVLTHLARVMMSPAEAQILIGVLQQTVETYEQTWGKIVPPVFQPTLEKKNEKTKGD